MSLWSGNPCRLCLRGNSLNPIPNDPIYLYAIFDASGVKVSPRDELPQQLCDACFLFINKCNIFRNKSLETQKILLDMINKRKEIAYTGNESSVIEIQNLSIMPSADDSTEIIDEKNTKNIDIQNVFNIENLSSDNEQLNTENRDIFDGISDLNLDDYNLNESNEVLVQDNEGLNESYEVSIQDNEGLNESNEVFIQDNEDLNLGNEVLIPNNEVSDSDNEDLHPDNNNLKKINTNTKKSLENAKATYTASYINKRVAKCNICGKKMLPKSIRNHLKRHKIYDKVLKRGCINISKQPLADFNTIHSDNEVLNSANTILNLTNIQDNEDLNESKKALNQDNKNIKNIKPTSKTININSEVLNQDNEVLRSDNIDRKKIDTNTSDTIAVADATYINRKLAKCNVCEKEMLPRSMKGHLKRHESVLKKASKKVIKKPLAECDICGRKMLKKRLLAHFLIHEGTPGQLICKHCGKVFERPNSLLRHCRAKHDYVKVDKCSLCDYMGCSEYEVKVHEKAHMGGDALTCKICGKSLKWKISWERHMAEHEDPKIQCTECTEKFHTSVKLARHKLRTHSATSFTSLDKITIQTHVTKKMDIKNVYAGQINQNIEGLNQDNVELHLDHADKDSVNDNLNKDTDKINEDLHTDDETLKFEYETLNSDFEDLDEDNVVLDQDNVELNPGNIDLNEVINVMNTNIMENKNPDKLKNLRTAVSGSKSDKRKKPKRKVKCDVCGLELLPKSMPAHLNRHELYGNDLKKRFKNYEISIKRRSHVECDTCGKRMPKKDLLAHLLTHDSKPGGINCKHCGKVFHRPNRLLIHCRAKHGYEKVDKCSYCDYMGSSKYIVKYHEEHVHKGGSATTCEICGKHFKTTKGIATHLAQHEDPKILCTECPETFHTPNQLHQHTNSVHKGLPVQCFQCPYCSHTTENKRYTVIHMKRAHNATDQHNIKKVLKYPRSELKEKNKPRKRGFFRNPLSLDILDQTKEDNTKENTEIVNFLSVFHKHLDLDLNKDDNEDLSTELSFQVSDLNVDGNVVSEVIIGNEDLHTRDLSPDSKIARNESLLADVNIDPRTGYGQCNECGEWMLKRSLIKHITAHGRTNVQIKMPKLDPFSITLDCNICEKKIKKERFKRHLSRHARLQRKSIVCEHCGLKFERHSSLLSHCRARHGYKKTDMCSFCPYQGLNARQVKLHERLHTGEKPYTCHVCQKSFHLSSTYKCHMTTHDRTQNSVECKVCKKTMLKRYYAGHKKTHEPNYEPPPPRKQAYKECPKCSKKVLQNNMKDHMATHDGTEKKFSCQHCEQSFTRQSRLLRHCRASHGYEKTDLCSYCDYRGCSRAEVKIHERKHTGERPYVCLLCGVAFRFSASYQRHQAEKHGKGNVVQCDLCPETFSTSRLLSSHKYVKHSKHTYSYECALCHKQYKHRGAARKHLAKHHNETNFINKIVKVPQNNLGDEV